MTAITGLAVMSAQCNSWCYLQSIEAGREWKAAYERTAKAVAARSAKPWNFDVSSVFNFVDAFKERCRYARISRTCMVVEAPAYMRQLAMRYTLY